MATGSSTGVSKRDSETINVLLLDEGVYLWRPVEGRRLPGGAYLILEQDYDHDTETWQFKPGTVVKCRVEERNGRPVTIATAKARQAATG